jgi:hypothetical protein
MLASKLPKPTNYAEPRMDLLVLVHEGMDRGLQIHRLAQGPIRPTRLGGDKEDIAIS